MLLLSWNVAGRVKRQLEQAERMLGLAPDVVCLQEVSLSTLPIWHALFQDAGYVGIEHGELSSARSRSLAVLTAARTPLHAVLVDGVPWPERVLAVHLSDGTEVVNVHSPISPKPELAKVRTHEAVHRHLADEPPAGHARILCGDLNTPRTEHADGSVWTFARDRFGRLRPERGERWDHAELALIRGLQPYGYRDAFRLLHSHDSDELSWEWPRGGGYRLDHLIVSSHLTVAECRYQHHWRTEGLSDHSALTAVLG